MDGRRWAAWLRAGILLECLALVQGFNCSSTEYLWKDRCCSRCPPGQKVEADCLGESHTACGPCEEHHFQGSWTKEHHCTPHRSCDKKAGLTVYLNGNQKRDVVCRCQEGTHCSSHECQTCRPHRLCRAGEGVHQEASHLNDTLCVQCPWGSFSNLSSSTARCQPWSSCTEKGLVLNSNGTQATDVVCGVPSITPKAGQTHWLVLLPLAALLLGGLLFWWHKHGKSSRKQPQNPPQEPREPTENEEECSAFPIQESPLGEQTGIEERGKDCHLAQQEQV